MDEYVIEKRRVTAKSLMVTIACCKVILNLDDLDLADWVHESDDYMTAFQLMAYESLFILRADLSRYSDSSARFSHVLKDTNELRDLISSNRKPFRTKSLFAHAFYEYRTQFEMKIERYETLEGQSYTAFYLNLNTIDEIISKLYWILRPEVVYTGNLNQMAYEAVCRSRLRARDILNRLAVEMPCPQFLRDYCVEGVIGARDLQDALDLRRDWPGKNSEDFIFIQ